MKTSSIIKTALVTVGFSAFACIGSAQAQIINVKLGSPNSSGYVYTLDGTASNTSTVAPIGYSGTVWNDEDSGPSGSSLLTSTGGTTDVSFNLTGYDGVSLNSAGNPPTASNIVMFQGDYYVSAGDTETLTLTGLTGTDYNLALVGVYGPGGGNPHYGASFTNGSTTLTETGVDASGSNTLVAGPGTGSSYVEFTNLTPVSGDITLTITAQGSDALGDLNGFQLQEVPAAPEPSTYALLGLGALALLVVSRRRKA